MRGNKMAKSASNVFHTSKHWFWQVVNVLRHHGKRAYLWYRLLHLYRCTNTQPYTTYNSIL